MKVTTEGHTYELHNFENKGFTQTLQFIHKEPINPPSKLPMARLHTAPRPKVSDELKTIADGTTNEEVLEVLIDRMNYLQSKFPCRENAIVITKLEESLMWLNKRTADRLKRGVEGKHQK